MKEFRELYADEIEVRAAVVRPEGVSLLLYKDARCDMKILDETVGPMNWQRHHSRDNANCIVSIWDPDKKVWIEKEDVGCESNTQAEKGLASDSFKRACFNWGIGRSLYTAPFIYIKGVRVEQKNGRYQLPSSTKFYVSKYEVSDGRISALELIDNNNKVVFTYPNAWSRKPIVRDEVPEALVPAKPSKVDYSYGSTGTSAEKPVSKPVPTPAVEEPTEYCNRTLGSDGLYELDLFDDKGNALFYDDEGKQVTSGKKIAEMEFGVSGLSNSSSNEHVNVTAKDEGADLSNRFRIRSAYFGEGAKGAYVKIYYIPCAGGNDLVQLQSLGNKYGVAALVKSLKGLDLVPQDELMASSVENLEPIKSLITKMSSLKNKFEFNLEHHKNARGYDEFFATK